MKLTTTASLQMSADRRNIFDYITCGDNWPHILPPLFPLAGIQSITLLKADSPGPGVRRQVTMTDGMQIIETIDEHRAPAVHAYSWGDGLSPPLSLIVRRAAARWTLEESEQTTSVTWTYEFTLTSPLVLPVAGIVFRRFRTWMQRGLQQVQQATAAPQTDRTTTSEAG